MHYRSIDARLFVENRERLRNLLPGGGLAVVQANDVLPTNADGTLLLHQNSDLFYLTGVDQEETILVLAPDAVDEKLREVLFLRETSPEIAVWEGARLTKEEAVARTGVKTVKWLSEFPRLFRSWMCEAGPVFLNLNEHKRAVVTVETREMRFVRETQRAYPLHRYERLAPLMHRLRLVKSPLELGVIRDACELTGRGFRRVLRFVKPGVTEAEVEAEWAHEFIRNGGGFAYPPIIAAGKNSCVLHYVRNDQVCRRGEVLLLDVAARCSYYNSDLTRTIPVGGRFSRRQREVYEAVLRVFRETVKAMVPGALPRDVQRRAEEATERELVGLGLLKRSEVRRRDPANPPVKRYFMHGVAHPIGLDVHDVGDTRQPIQAGWVLTCEPAIYVPEEGFAVRLENDIWVTPDGPVDLMASIPIEAREIEEGMRGKG